MRSVSTSSLEVVSHYAAAVEAQARGQFEEALEKYAKAVELDPEFALGYQGMAAMSRNLGKIEDSEKYSKEALRFIDKLTDRERFATRAYYYRNTGDNQQCVKEYGELLERFPSDHVAHNQRAACFSEMRKMREALDEMRRATEMLPNHVGYRVNLALISDYASDFETAEREIRTIERPNFLAVLVLAYSQAGRGQVREATETYQKLVGDGRSEAPITRTRGLATFLFIKAALPRRFGIMRRASRRI